MISCPTYYYSIEDYHYDIPRFVYDSPSDVYGFLFGDIEYYVPRDFYLDFAQKPVFYISGQTSFICEYLGIEYKYQLSLAYDGTSKLYTFGLPDGLLPNRNFDLFTLSLISIDGDYVSVPNIYCTWYEFYDLDSNGDSPLSYNFSYRFLTYPSSPELYTNTNSSLYFLYNLSDSLLSSPINYTDLLNFGVFGWNFWFILTGGGFLIVMAYLLIKFVL